MPEFILPKIILPKYEFGTVCVTNIENADYLDITGFGTWLIIPFKIH